ncbi:MAG TPA: ATP-dependent nuclease subunit B, partial [Phycisphaerae bacterium]|nr:ATP-dependent nuclease subunit B [Phycisphaerae bacterium]
MAVRLIAGRAGSGKTHWCQGQICEALASSLVEGPRLIMLVPEQAALQMERGLLAMSPARTLGRCEVLSFRRLAHRILNESAGPTPAILSPTGRQMALRHLIARHRKSLREFAGVADRGGTVAAVARTITELLQECASPDRLEAEGKAALAEQDPSGPRLHDIALLYRAYLDYLGSQRVDPEGVLDLARSRLE